MKTKAQGAKTAKQKITPVPNLDEWLEIGKIVAPQGLSGELRVYPQSDFPERFEVPGTRWLWHPGDREPQPVELLSGRYVEGKNLCVISLAGVENRNQAEALRDYMLLVPASDRPQLGEDEYHVTDLLGILVFIQESGKLVGEVVDVISAGNDLLEVEMHEGNEPGKPEKSPKTVLIPFVKEIAPVVDLSSRRIEITPPPGLLELAITR
ncbi:ribosome maturation factor RimM [Anabaenopsis elenkinii]|jgi:16S rRNA processing protein RimM|uniref:Ribosome maturation factor RimM n=1 Tax=Anabaenopsis elenkinii CCIBt3563 TaxID=2779889 RepID=A0A7S6U6Q5_9CYAN|nr:ribosome maturation factor RimM [Anabaenopsis elenkinii]QOV23548.1 ribosome maturation factor RimM [Anabaenopsis elenkinii CCIBt3563]